MAEVKPPPHDTRIKGPAGREGKPRCVIVHTTQGSQRPGPSDRHGVLDYIAARGICVPWITDNDGITRMAPWGHLGDNHACGLDDKATGIEQVGMAQWSRKYWLREYRPTIRHTAWVVAYEVARMGLPVNQRTLEAHVFGHAEDEKCDRSACSDHWDPGSGFPFDVLFEDAIDYAASQGWRAVATKGERRRVRRFAKVKEARRWARQLRRRGWAARVRRRPLSGGELEDAQASTRSSR